MRGLYANEVDQKYVFFFDNNFEKVEVMAKNVVHATRLFYEANPDVLDFQVECPGVR